MVAVIQLAIALGSTVGGVKAALHRGPRQEGHEGPHGGRLLALVLSFIVLVPLAAAAFALWTSGHYVSQTYLWRSGPPGIDVATLLLGWVMVRAGV
mgnify:CR=1 FL=1